MLYLFEMRNKTSMCYFNADRMTPIICKHLKLFSCLAVKHVILRAVFEGLEAPTRLSL